MLGAMSDKLKNIAAQVFQVDANSIELAMTPEDIEK
jgi:hypothetical protein